MAHADKPRQVFGPIPIAQAMLLCEKIVIEAGTDKKTLVGVFDQIRIPPQGGATPTVVGMHLFARLYDAAGRYVFKIHFVHTDTEERIVEAETDPTDVPDPLSACDIALSLPPLPLPRPGLYEFRLYANDAYLAHVTVRAIEQGR